MEHGYEAYTYHSLKGIYYSLRAGVYIFDNYSKDIDFWLSGGALKINLWHGSGNKKTNHDNEFDRIRHPKNQWERFKTFPRRLSDEKPGHYTLATSKTMAKIYVSAFATDLSHILISGQPRNDMLFPSEQSHIQNLCTKKEQALIEQIMLCHEQGMTILSYMPTFRDSEKLFFDVMDLKVFNDFLGDHHMLLVTKLHTKSKLKAEFEAIHYSNIINADAEIDIYSFQKKIDILITDYSSVYTDFMLLNRPVIAFWYDWNEYSQDTRACYVDQTEYMPECRAASMTELMDALLLVQREDYCREQRLKSRDRMFDDTGVCSEKLYNKIRKILQV